MLHNVICSLLIFNWIIFNTEQCWETAKEFKKYVESLEWNFLVFIYLSMLYNLIYIIDPQFLAYLCNGLFPGVIYYKPLSYEANFLQA